MSLFETKRFWVFTYSGLATIIFLFRYLGWEVYHWPLDILAGFSLIVWVKKSSKNRLLNINLVYWYFVLISIGLAFVSFFPFQTPLMIGIVFYLFSRIIFCLFIEGVVYKKKFTSLKYNLVLLASLIAVLVLTYNLVGDYLPLEYSVFVILFSFVHGLNLNYLFYLENSSYRIPLIIATIALGFHDLLGAINFFYKIIDYNFLFDYVLLVIGNVSFAISAIYLGNEYKSNSFVSN